MKKIYTSFIISVLLFYSASAQVHQLWGTTSSGGIDSTSGTIFKINDDGTGFGVVHSCDTTSGYSPYGALVLAPNGYLYGMTAYGGIADAGVIFEYDPAGNTYSKVFDFDYTTNGGDPDGNLIVANGKLYGMAAGGGVNGDGTIFSFDPAGNIFSHLYDFNDSTGSYPYGSLIQASDGKLYGLTYEGGSNDDGTLFSFDLTDSMFTVLHNFDSLSGVAPNGSLMQATNGKLYGMTSWGGLYDAGVIFSFNATGNVYSNIYSFNDTAGSHPFGSLIQFADGLLYGMASGGGVYSYGNIFNFNPATNVYSDLLDFNGTNGASPDGDLLADNGKLYGMTSFGGLDSLGNLFSYDPSNNTFADLFDFNYANGIIPEGNLIEINITGISEKTTSDNIQLYPNPAGKELRIKNEGLRINSITIYNSVGQSLFSEQFDTSANGSQSEIKIDVSDYSSGLYFIKVNDDQNQWSGKFVKE